MSGWLVTIAYERPPTRAVHQFTGLVEGREQLEAVAQAATDLQLNEGRRVRVLSVGLTREPQEPPQGAGGGA